MRPRKVVLILDASPLALSVASFTLDVRGFRPVTVETATEAVGILRSRHVDLVLAQAALTPPYVVARMREAAPEAKIALVGSEGAAIKPHGADAFLPALASTEKLICSLRELTARKRGPRKGWKRPPAAQNARQGAVCA